MIISHKINSTKLRNMRVAHEVGHLVVADYYGRNIVDVNVTHPYAVDAEEMINYYCSASGVTVNDVIQDVEILYGGIVGEEVLAQGRDGISTDCVHDITAITKILQFVCSSGLDPSKNSPMLCISNSEEPEITERVKELAEECYNSVLQLFSNSNMHTHHLRNALSKELMEHNTISAERFKAIKDSNITIVKGKECQYDELDE